MHWIVILQIVASVLYVAFLIYQYSLKTVGPFVKLSVYLTWLICFSNVVLLPYDVYFSLHSDYELGVAWKVSYAFIFFLTWVLLPIAQEYEEAGQFTIKAKLKRAIIKNLIIYGVFAIVGVLGLGSLIISKKVVLSNLLSVLLVASNAFGMLLVVIFLSYGLTAIPRTMWRNKNYKLQLKKLQFDASSLSRKKEKVMQELQLQVKQILWKIKKDDQSVQTTEILKLVPEDLLKKWSKNVPDLGEVNVIKVHKNMKKLTLQLSRLESRWQDLTIKAFKIQDVLSYFHSRSRRIQSTFFQHSKYEIINYFQWIWNCRIKVYLIPCFSVIFALFTLTIVVAQLAVFIPQLSFINPYSRLTKSIQQFVWLDLLLLLVLGYMAFCIYYALFRLKFSNYYGLYWGKQTDAASLIFYAINCSRITNPLNYNFLQIIQDNDTAFVQAMGSTPLLGKTLSIIFPVLIIILIISNAFDVYSRICKRVGLSKFQFQQQFNHQNIEQGKRLLQKARMQLQTMILNSNCKNLAQFRSYKSEVGPGLFSSSHTGVQGEETMSSKESTSFEALTFNTINGNSNIEKPKFFNQFKKMDKIAKILQM